MGEVVPVESARSAEQRNLRDARMALLAIITKTAEAFGPAVKTGDVKVLAEAYVTLRVDL